jgi:hypothetical protein
MAACNLMRRLLHRSLETEVFGALRRALVPVEFAVEQSSSGR